MADEVGACGQERAGDEQTMTSALHAECYMTLYKNALPVWTAGSACLLVSQTARKQLMTSLSHTVVTGV